VNYQVRYTKQAKNDLKKLYGFLLENDINSAKIALNIIRKNIEFLQYFPFSCRKSQSDNPFFRETIISFGTAGYVALFEIENDNTITILAIRHQREEDYY
jgi:plasmid stabilization system protein ParE